MSIKRIATAALIATLASACGTSQPGYEVLDFGDEGIDVTSDAGRRDTGVDAMPDGTIDAALDVASDAVDTAPDVAGDTVDTIEDVYFADGFTNGSCAAGDAMACPASANADVTCESMRCVVRCRAGFGDCDGVAANGCEVATASDPTNCSACGTVCTGATNASPRCTGGTCGIACVTNFANCDGVTANGCEINVQVSPTNCGTCGTVCLGAANATPSCAGAICGIRCDVGYLNCDGSTANGCETAGTVCP